MVAGDFYFTAVAAAITASLLGSVCGVTDTPPTTADIVVVEVTLEKELQIIDRNSTEAREASEYENDTVYECLIHGLSPQELAVFEEGSQNIVVNTRSLNSSAEVDDEPENSNETLHVELSVLNDTLVVKTKERLSTCEVRFVDSIGSGSVEDSNETASSRQLAEESAPVITTDYDRVILMKGAPDQVISCVAHGNPIPKMRWTLQGKTPKNAVTLSRDDEESSNLETSTYLMFPKVEEGISGNYTCVAENVKGRATRTLEVDVISVEALAECNDISSENPIIFKQNIDNFLHRSKRHLWYQWRSQKIYIPPFNRPLDPYGPEEDHNSNLQKMVNLITERLNLADKVAVNKWDNSLPVEDRPREEIILENMVRLAKNQGLSTEWAHRFFKDQIEGNKDIQYELIRIWHIEGVRPPGPPVDLGNEVRPEIDRINGELLKLAKDTERERKGWKCREEVEKNARYATFLYNLDPLHQKALQRATENVCMNRPGRDGPPLPFHPYPPPQFPPFE